MLRYRNNIFFINDSLENKISYYHLLFFLIVLPFDRFYSEIILISYAAHTIIHLNKKKIKGIFTLQTLILTSAFFVNLIGTVYSPDKKPAFNDMERQLAIFLFPVLVSASGLKLAAHRDALLKVFGFTCVITVLYLFIYSFRLIAYNHLPVSNLFSTFFTNHNFSAPVEMHATYLSMYICLSLTSYLFFFLKEKTGNYKIFYGICILILLAGLMQLASRAVFISTLFIILVLYPLFIEKGASRSKFLMIVFPIILVAFIGIYRIDWFRKRYISELRNDLTQVSINNDIIEPRIIRWRVAWKLFQQNPLLGYGSGTEKKILMENYFEKKLYNSYLNKLNAHNEYLSIMLKTGIWGLLVYLFTLIYGYIAAWYNRDIVFAGFVSLIAVVSFSENILDVNKTIFFYSFFFSLFIYSSKNLLPVNTIFKAKKKTVIAKNNSF